MFSTSRTFNFNLPLTLPALSLSAEQTDFCAALEQLAADASSPPHISCTIDCATPSYTCTIEADGLVFQSHSTFSLCSDPPTYNPVVGQVNGTVVLNETLGESKIVMTPLFVANFTVHQLENAIAIMVILLINTISMLHLVVINLFPMQVQTYSGNSTTTVFNYTVLPYDPSLCPENISGSQFSCPPLSSEVPATSVHELKPNDVKVGNTVYLFSYIPVHKGYLLERWDV